ncbi:MAG: DinB family protein [Ignavibacteria bacterium]|nr:DinB family protein [Ignavibacteria bacterium]
MMNNLPNELQKLSDEFRNMKSDAALFFEKVKDKEFNKTPPNNGWSIGGCIDHLIVTGSDYCDILDIGLKKLEEKNQLYSGEMKFSFLGRKFIKILEPPVKRKFKAPGKWKPDTKINKSKAVAAYLQLQDRWVNIIERSAQWDFTKLKLPSPAISWIKFSAFDILAVNSAHQRRHLEQAKNIKKNLK